ncbi:protein mini spindles-like [Entamoeba marina]
MSSIPPNDLFDAIKSSQWKTRVEAYLSISEEINKGNLNDIPTFIPQIISDTNLAAFETALDKDCSNKSLIISTLPQLINRGLIGRPKSKDVSKKIILLLCEKGFYSDVFDALYTATSSKNVKIVTEAIRCILVILTQCGPNVVGIKELLAKIKVWLGNKDKDVRKASLNIIHYFIGNIGNAMNEFISTLTTVQKKELEDYCKKNTPQHTSPTLHIEGVSNDFNAQNIVSILHISKVVPKNFQQLLRTPNWKEKQQVFTSIYNAIHNRVVEVDNSFLECLKMGLNDANTTVSAKAFVLFNYLLEKKTIPNAEPYLSIILSKLKSPSSAVTNSASVALLAISAEQITYNVLTTVYDFITTRHTTIYTVVCNWLEKVAKQLGEIKKQKD